MSHTVPEPLDVEWPRRRAKHNPVFKKARVRETSDPNYRYVPAGDLRNGHQIVIKKRWHYKCPVCFKEVSVARHSSSKHIILAKASDPEPTRKVVLDEYYKHLRTHHGQPGGWAT